MARSTRKRLPTVLASSLIASLVLTSGMLTSPSAAQAACHPIQTTPEFTGVIPTAHEVLGFDLGDQEVSAAESDAYLGAIDDASDRVTSGTAGFSVEGRPLRYAIVGTPEHVTTAVLTAVEAAIDQLRDPATPDDQAEALAASTPAILLVQANVHGGEESGTESSLQLLYELADRDDCVSEHDPRQHDRRDHPDPEPRRPRGGHAPQRLRHRHEPRLVRPDPAGDGREARAPPTAAAGAGPRRPRDGCVHVLLPAELRPRLPRDRATSRTTGSTASTAPAMAAEFDRQRIRYFNYEPTTSSACSTAIRCRRSRSTRPG